MVENILVWSSGSTGGTVEEEKFRREMILSL